MEEKVLEILKKENQKLRKICLSDKKLEELRNDFLKNNPRFFKEEDVRTYFKIILQKAIQDDPNGLLAKKLIGPYKQLYLKFHNRFNFNPSENTYSIFSKICLNVMLNYEKDTPIDSIILKRYQKEVLKFNILRKNTNENLSLNEDTFLKNINYDVAYRLRDYFKVYLNDYYSILVKVHGTNFNENNVILKDEMDIYNTAKKVFLKKYNSTLTSPSLIQKYNISYSKIMSFLEKMKNDNLEYYQIFKEVYGLTFQDNYGILLDKMEIFEEAKEYFENIMYEMTSDQIYKISCRYEKKYIIDLLNYYKKNKKEDYSILIMAHGKKFDEQNKVWNKEYYKTIRNFYQDLKEKTMLFESVFEYDKNKILNLLSAESKNKYFKIIKKRFGTDLCSCQILENEKEYSLLKEAFVYIEKEILSYISLFKHVDKEDIWSRLEYFHVFFKEYEDIIVKVHGKSLDELNFLTKEEKSIYMDAVGIIMKSVQSRERKLNVLLSTEESVLNNVLEFLKSNANEYYVILQKKFGLRFNEVYSLNKADKILYKEALEYLKTLIKKDKKNNIFAKFSDDVLQREMKYLKYFYPDYAFALERIHGESLKEEILNMKFDNVYKNACNFVLKDLEENSTCLLEKISLLQLDFNEVMSFVNDEETELLKKKYGFNLDEFHFLDDIVTEKRTNLIVNKIMSFYTKENKILAYDEEMRQREIEYLDLFYPDYASIIRKKIYLKEDLTTDDEKEYLVAEQKFIDDVTYWKISPNLYEKLGLDESKLNDLLIILKKINETYYNILKKGFGLDFSCWYRFSDQNENILRERAINYLEKLLKIEEELTKDVLDKQINYYHKFYPDYAKVMQKKLYLKEELTLDENNIYANAMADLYEKIIFKKQCVYLHEKIGVTHEVLLKYLEFVKQEKNVFYEILEKKYGFDFDDWYKLGKEHGALLGRAILYLKNIHLNNHKNKQEYFKQIKKYDNDLLVSTLKYLEKFYFLESKNIIKVFGRNFDKQNEENINNSSMEIFIKFLNAKKFDINEIIPVRNDIFGLFVSHLSICEQDIIQKKYGLDYNKEYFLDNGEENILKRAVEKLRVFYEEYKKMNSLLPEIINFKMNNIDFLKKYFENRLDVMTILNKLEDVGEILKLYSPSQILEVLQDVKEVSNSSINVSYEIRKIVDSMWEKRKYLFDSQEREKLFIDEVANQLNEIKESELQNFELEEFVKEKLNEDYTLRNKLWTYFIPVFNDFLEENRLKIFQEYEEIFMNNVLYFVLSDLDEIDLVDNIHDKTLKDILELEKKKNRVLLEGILKNNPKDVLRKSLNDVLKTELAYYNILTLYIDGNLNYRDSNKYSFEHYRASMFLKNVVFHNINLSSIDEIERYAKKINRIGLLRFSVQQIRELATNFYNKYENDIKKLSVLEKQDKFKKYFCEQIMFEIFENQNEEMLRNIIDCYLYIYNNINTLYNVKDTLNERKIFVNICIICNLYRKDSDSVTKKISNLYKKQVIKSQVNVKKKENNLQITVQQVLQINHKKMLNPLKKVINLLPNNEKGQLNEIFSFEKHHNIIYKMDLILKMYGLVFLVTDDLDHELSILLQKDDLILEYQKIKEVFLEQFSLESFKKCQNYNEHLLEIFVGDVKYDLDISYEEYLAQMSGLIGLYQKETLIKNKQKLLEYLESNNQLVPLILKKLETVN